jgi:beta-phosphoglucomutase-like phosphatase (HAD superfamily)
MTPPALVIFDCDGVLVDSEPIAAQCFAEALGEIGLAWTPEEVDRRFRGRRLEDCLGVLVEEIGGDLPDRFGARLEARTRAAFRDALRAVPGVEHALARITVDLGLPVCVASSGAPDKIRFSLGLTGLDRFFGEHLFSAEQVPRGKPAPDLFLHAAARMGVAADACAVIEDAPAGIEAGRAAGMRVFAYGAMPPLQPDVTGFTRMSALPALLVAARRSGAADEC